MRCKIPQLGSDLHVTVLGVAYNAQRQDNENVPEWKALFSGIWKALFFHLQFLISKMDTRIYLFNYELPDSLDSYYLPVQFLLLFIK